MELHLDEQECEVLREVLDGELGELALEIAHTDNRQYRDGLRARRDLIRSITGRLVGVSV